MTGLLFSPRIKVSVGAVVMMMMMMMMAGDNF
jgi:hypothetical protein